MTKHKKLMIYRKIYRISPCTLAKVIKLKSGRSYMKRELGITQLLLSEAQELADFFQTNVVDLFFEEISFEEFSALLAINQNEILHKEQNVLFDKLDVLSKISYFRYHQDMSITEMAHTIGVTCSTYSNYERGITRIKLIYIKKIVEFLNVDIDDLFYKQDFVKSISNRKNSIEAIQDLKNLVMQNNIGNVVRTYNFPLTLNLTDKFRYLRERNKLSCNKMSEALNVHIQLYHKLEASDNFIAVDYYLSLAVYYGLTLGELLEEIKCE